MLFTAILLGCITGVVAYVYAHLLTEVDMILAQPKYIASQWASRSKICEWILTPVILCPVCVSGQMALWSLLYYMIDNACYSLPAHIAGICFSILITHTLMKKL